MQPTGLAGISSASGLLALSGALGAQAQLLAKDDRGVHDTESRGECGESLGWLDLSEPGNRWRWALGLPLLPMPFLPGHFPGMGARAEWGPLVHASGLPAGLEEQGACSCKGFGWGTSSTDRDPRGRVVRWAGGGSSLGGPRTTLLLSCWSGLAVNTPVAMGEGSDFPVGLLVVTQRVPLSLLLLLLLLLCVATATDRDPGPVSAFFFSCTILWWRRL